MQVTVLGSSGSYTVPGRPGSGFLVEAGETRIWCDAGPGTFEALADRIDLEMLTAVVVSHAHVDHSVDVLVAFHRFGYGLPSRNRIPLLAPADVLERLEAFLRPKEDHPWFTVFAPHPVEEGDRLRVGEMDVRFATATHSVPAVVTRFEAGGRSLVYTGDTGAEGEWRRLVEGADLLLAEATLLESQGQEWLYHLTAADAGRIARTEGAARLMLTHIPPHVDPDVSAAEAESTYDRPVAVAVPGAVHRV